MGNAVESDDCVAPSGTSDEDAAEVKRIQKMNQKAAGILLNSSLTDAEKGQSMFCLIEKFHNAKAGHAGGQFCKEWTCCAVQKQHAEELHPRPRQLLSG